MLDELFAIIEDRKNKKTANSYTCQLFNEGEDKISRKLNEETLEVILASKCENDQRLIEEASDLIYHLFVLLSYKNLTLDQVKSELSMRHKDKS